LRNINNEIILSTGRALECSGKPYPGVWGPERAAKATVVFRKAALAKIMRGERFFSQKREIQFQLGFPLAVPHATLLANDASLNAQHHM